MGSLQKAWGLNLGVPSLGGSSALSMMIPCGQTSVLCQREGWWLAKIIAPMINVFLFACNFSKEHIDSKTGHFLFEDKYVKYIQGRYIYNFASGLSLVLKLRFRMRYWNLTSGIFGDGTSDYM